MKQAQDPNLADLKKLLKRLEKIDPEGHPPTPPDPTEAAAGNARKLKEAILDRPANDEAPVDGLLQLKSLKGQPTSQDTAQPPSELPVIVRQSLPATTDPAHEPGTFQTVIIASVTAAVVSALATAGTVYWINLESNRLAFTPAPDLDAPAAKQETFSQASIGGNASGERPTLGEQTAASKSATNETDPAAGQPATSLSSGTSEAPPTAEPAQFEVAAGGDDTGAVSRNEAGTTNSASAESGAVSKTEASVAQAEPSPQPGPFETIVTEGGNTQTAPGDPAGGSNADTARNADLAAPQATEPAEATGDAVPGITPPRPQLAGIPDVSGEISAQQAGPSLASTNEPTSTPQEPKGAPPPAEAEYGPVRPATAIMTARELVAALTTSNAQASESWQSAQSVEPERTARFAGADTLNGLSDFGTLSSSTQPATQSAPAETSAPDVAVFEAPPEPTSPIEIAPQASQDAAPPTASEIPAASVASEGLSLTTAPQQTVETAALDPTVDQPAVETGDTDATKPIVVPGQAALHHPDVLAIKTGEPIDFPITVLGADDEIEGHYLIISGLKRGARPSAGSELMFDTWRINAADLAGLTLNIPDGFARRLHLTAELRRPSGETRQKTTMVLTMDGSASRVVDDSEEKPGLPASVLRNVDDGEIQIDNGSLRAARVLFRRAADAGSSRAAMLMAATYDPNFVSAFPTMTPPKPDVDEASRWYMLAGELGAPGALARRQNLPTN